MERTNLFNLLQMKSMNSKIPTNIKQLDDALAGGLATGQVTELCGSYSSGKTQLCLQLCLLPKFVDNAKTIYIDTNQDFSMQRLQEIVARIDVGENLGQSQRSSNIFVEKLHYIYCKDYVELIASIVNLEDILQCDTNIKLIIIDSFAFLMRSIEDVGLRTRIIYEIITDLQIYASKYEITFVITNELTEVRDPKIFAKPALGDTFFHKINHRIFLKQASKNEERYAVIEKSQNAPKTNIQFKITQSGLQ